MDGAVFSFSTQQANALDAVSQWLKFDTVTKPIFRLFGYAGTGKTTIAKYLAEGLDGDVVYAAFSGKAALAMQMNGCDEASTIHSLIYTPRRDGAGGATFVLNHNSTAASAALIIIDECSMVDDILATDLLSFGTPLLVLGDPAQLPPPGNGAGYFTKAAPDLMLTEIHRQAKDNPIIELATMVRNGIVPAFGKYGSSVIMRSGDFSPEMIFRADQVLVGTNNTRRDYNTFMRAHVGRRNELPEPGDTLVCLRNDYSLGILNGALFKVLEVEMHRSMAKTLVLKLTSLDSPRDAPIDVAVRQEFFLGGGDQLSYNELKNTQRFDYGNALTVHKAQGSQWPSVLIDDESSAFREDRHLWLYTAITRASEKVIIGM